MRRFYLDTHIFTYLTEDSRQQSHLASRLRSLVRARNVEICGSLELLEEFIPRAHVDPDGYKRMVDMFWTLSGPRVLRPWNELIRSEIEKGSRLSLREAYLDSDIVRSVHQLSYDSEAHRECADEVGQRKIEYEQSMREAAGTFDKIATERWGAKGVRDHAADLPMTREAINDWGQDILIRPEPSRYGLSGDETSWPDLSTLPCSSAYVAMTLALRRKCHETKRKDTGADSYDSMHYVMASMTNAFVTDDKKLRHAIGLIEWKPTQVLTLDEFARTLNRM